MELETVTIPRQEARQSYLDYRREAKRTNDPIARAELAEMAKAFRIAAREEVALVALSPTIRRGGTVIRSRVGRNLKGEINWRYDYLLPALAAAPAQARFVYTLGVQADGSVRFSDSLNRRHAYRSGVVELPDAGFETPPSGSTFETASAGTEVWTRWEAWSAMVPITPPKYRPARGFAQCHVLWEVEDWTWVSVPSPPGDPALLRHVGGDVYAVLATWDLSPLEQLVLEGRRPSTYETGR